MAQFQLMLKNLSAFGCRAISGKYFGTELRWFEEMPPGKVLADAVAGDYALRVILLEGRPLTPEVWRVVKMNVEEWREVEGWNFEGRNKRRKKISSSAP